MRRGHEPEGLNNLSSFQGYLYGDLILATRDATKRSNAVVISSTSLSAISAAVWALRHRLRPSADRPRAGSTRRRGGPHLARRRRRRTSLKAGTKDHLPLALLARAAYRRRRAASGETDLIEHIRADLAEVEDIAGEEMRLYLTDLALERARLALDVPAAFDSPEAARAEAEAQSQGRRPHRRHRLSPPRRRTRRAASPPRHPRASSLMLAPSSSMMRMPFVVMTSRANCPANLRPRSAAP